MAWFVRDIWHKYHSWYFKIVSNYYNNFEISLVVFMPNIKTKHAITYTNLITIGDTKEIKRKKMLEINRNLTKIWTGRRLTKRVGLVFGNPSSGRGNLNLERPDYKSRVLTIRPRHCCLFPFRLIRDILTNHNHNKILKSDWISTVLISALNRTV